MALQSNIQKRGGVYYARLGLPAELIRARAKAGLKRRLDVCKSLGTRDPKVAKRITPQVLDRMQAEFERELAELNGDGAPPRERKLHKPSAEEIAAVAWDMIQSDLRADAAERRQHPTAARRAELIESIREKTAALELPEDPSQRQLALIAATLDEITELDRPNIRREMRATEREAIAGENPQDAFENLAEAIIYDRGWDVLPGSDQFADLCSVLYSARIKALNAFRARDEGDGLSDVANPTTPAHVTAAKVTTLKSRAKPGESLLELLPQYLAEEGAALSSEDRLKKKNVVKLFSEFIGDKRNIGTITREDFRDFKLKLKHWPRVANNQSAFKGKDFNAIVKKNAELGRRAIGPQTVNNYLSSLGGYFGWLARNSYTKERDITHGLLLKIDRAASAREAYSDEELQAIFALPLFAGCASVDKPAEPGPARIDDWRFWIPVLCLYSGARLGEIAQLRVSDVVDVGGHWSMQITDEGEGMAVKTKDSVRVVPIHPEVIRLGFIRYHSCLATKGPERLFPELKPDSHGRFAGSITEWWRTYTERFQIQGSNSYRFRHTFSDALRAAGYLHNEIGPILGHSDGTITARYGNLPQVTVNRRAEMVAAAKFPIELAPPK